MIIIMKSLGNYTQMHENAAVNFVNAQKAQKYNLLHFFQVKPVANIIIIYKSM